LLYVIIALAIVAADILVSKVWLEKANFKSKTFAANLLRAVVSLTLAFLLKLPFGFVGASGGLIPFILAVILFVISGFSLRTAFLENVVEGYLPLRRILRNPFWPTVLLFGLVVPVGEEFLFRGVVQNLLTRGLGTVVGSTLSVIVFTGVHYENVKSGFETKEQFMRMLPGRVLITAILTWLYAASGSIWLVVFIHALQDLGTFLLAHYYTKKLGSQKLPSTFTCEESGTDIESSS
jgi:membrane protease YdiL (CAAX protease family)